MITCTVLFLLWLCRVCVLQLSIYWLLNYLQIISIIISVLLKWCLWAVLLAISVQILIPLNDSTTSQQEAEFEEFNCYGITNQKLLKSWHHHQISSTPFRRLVLIRKLQSVRNTVLTAGSGSPPAESWIMFSLLGSAASTCRNRKRVDQEAGNSSSGSARAKRILCSAGSEPERKQVLNSTTCEQDWLQETQETIDQPRPDLLCFVNRKLHKASCPKDLKVQNSTFSLD